jgi:ATP-dependent RNA helicase RhlE
VCTTPRRDCLRLSLYCLSLFTAHVRPFRIYHMSFKLLGLSANLLKSVESAGYTDPTPIQSAAIPVVLAGRDIVGCAQTGTGKTASFVLPMLDLLSQSRSNARNRAPRAIVVTPTRELTVQVENAVRGYGRNSRLFSQTVYGGVSIESQIKRLRRGVDIVVGTPGRLLDLIGRRVLDLSQIEYLVLDEADRMFDMGFIADIRKIVAETPKNRQTLLFSATMPPAIRSLANEILRDPESISIGEARNPAETVTQHVCSVPKDRKLDLLLRVLEDEAVDNVIVFSRTKHGADKISKRLGQQNLRSTVMHSNKTQSQRQRALDGLRNGRYNILVATDVAARGIDIDRVTHVINYDAPNKAEDYIHRIGRTGRAEASGDAITFVSRDEEKHIREIERHIGRSLDRRTFDGIEEDERPARPSSNGRPRGKKTGGNYRHGGKSRSGNRSRSKARS